MWIYDKSWSPDFREEDQLQHLFLLRHVKVDSFPCMYVYLTCIRVNMYIQIYIYAYYSFHGVRSNMTVLVYLAAPLLKLGLECSDLPSPHAGESWPRVSRPEMAWG